MLLQENKYINITGVYPNAVLIDATGPGLTDGSELVALNQNDGFEAFQQALMDYVSGSTNAPTGTMGTPNGVSEAAGVSQMLQAIFGSTGTGPGKGVILFGADDPSVTGDRILLLQGQGVLRSVYPDLDAKVYVGDANNAAVAAGGGSGLSRGGFYHADDAAGTIPNIAGVYLILPESRGYAMRVMDALASIDPQGALRFLGDNQLDAFQGWQLGADRDSTGLKDYWMRTATRDQTYTAGVSAGLTLTPMRDDAQGSNQMVKAMNDGTNGDPRTSSETRTANMSIQLGITY